MGRKATWSETRVARVNQRLSQQPQSVGRVGSAATQPVLHSMVVIIIIIIDHDVGCAGACGHVDFVSDFVRMPMDGLVARKSFVGLPFRRPCGFI